MSAAVPTGGYSISAVRIRPAGARRAVHCNIVMMRLSGRLSKLMAIGRDPSAERMKFMGK